MKRMLPLLALLGLGATTAPARAVDACVSNTPIDTPCESTVDTGIRKEYFGVLDHETGEPISPRRVAEVLGLQIPGYEPDSQYQVYLNRAAPNGKLLVYLPGTNGVTEDFTSLAARAADHGYRVIALAYWNSLDATAQNCKAYKDQSPGTGDGTTPPYTFDGCITDLYEGQFRNINVLTPALRNTPSGKKLNGGDQVQGRLRRLLQFLVREFPDDHWEQFAYQQNPANLENGSPYVDYAKITLMGHSTGSKVAAYIATQQPVARVIMLSGPNVTYKNTGEPETCPTAVGVPVATPIDRYYAYYNTHDDSHDEAVKCFKRMGLWNLATRRTIDQSFTRTGTHILSNEVEPVNDCDSSSASGRAHVSTANNCALHLAGGVSIPAPRRTLDVWDFLLAP